MVSLSETKVEARAEIDCGESGYFVGICSKLKICFICVVYGYYMTEHTF
jgi:hypothetical protein